jgi:hypothetical protein
MIRKRLIIFAIFSIFSLQAGDKAKAYTIEIDVNTVKANGKSWDVSGGSPDITISIDGQRLQFLEKCRDKYRCSLKFFSISDEWYFEIYDKDIMSDDLIGKGDCSEGDSCTLGLAKIKIEEL